MSDEAAVAVRGLRKTYRSRRGRHVAVQGLDMTVPTGGVHGFLGPNGSGKTTSIRMLLGLARADAGTMHIFGQPVPEQLPQIVARVGAIVESPTFFPAFSGAKNLSLLAEAIGADAERVHTVLEQTALQDRADDRFGTYSLGMKQRLAIAATLLKSPDLLIFDEPTNGLDPAGIREVRQTMRSLGQEGRTVLVSSHILAEVQQIADTVSIIGQGRLLAEGAVDDLMRGGAIRAQVPDPLAAVRVLARQGIEARVEDGAVLVSDEDDAADIARRLGTHDIWVSELTRTGDDLESVYLELTEAEGLEATGGVR